VSHIHQIQTGEVQVKGTKAVADSWCLIHSRNEDIPQHHYDQTSYLRLLSQCQQVDGQWKMRTLEAVYIRDSIAAVPPHSLPEFDSLVPGYRKSYRFTAWSIGRRGLQIRQDMPGSDRPEGIDEAVRRNQAWLDGDG
jgi:hypothetical protein